MTTGSRAWCSTSATADSRSSATRCFARGKFSISSASSIPARFWNARSRYGTRASLETARRSWKSTRRARAFASSICRSITRTSSIGPLELLAATGIRDAKLLTSRACNCLKQAPLRDDGAHPSLELGAGDEAASHVIEAAGGRIRLVHPERESGEIAAAAKGHVVEAHHGGGCTRVSRQRGLARRILRARDELRGNGICLHRDGRRTRALRGAESREPERESEVVRKAVERAAVEVHHHGNFRAARGGGAEEPRHEARELRGEEEIVQHGPARLAELKLARPVREAARVGFAQEERAIEVRHESDVRGISGRVLGAREECIGHREEDLVHVGAERREPGDLAGPERLALRIGLAAQDLLVVARDHRLHVVRHAARKARARKGGRARPECRVRDERESSGPRAQARRRKCHLERAGRIRRKRGSATRRRQGEISRDGHRGDRRREERGIGKRQGRHRARRSHDRAREGVRGRRELQPHGNGRGVEDRRDGRGARHRHAAHVDGSGHHEAADVSGHARAGSRSPARERGTVVGCRGQQDEIPAVGSAGCARERNDLPAPRARGGDGENRVLVHNVGRYVLGRERSGAQLARGIVAPALQAAIARERALETVACREDASVGLPGDVHRRGEGERARRVTGLPGEVRTPALHLLRGAR